MKTSRTPSAPATGRRSAPRAEPAPPADSSAGGEPAPLNPQPPPHDEIARRAYQHWERSGGGDGSDQQHWYAAEQEMRGGGQLPDPEETRRSEP